MKDRKVKAEKLKSGRYRIRPYDENGERKSFTFSTEHEALSEIKKYQIQTEEIKQGLRLPRLKEIRFLEVTCMWLEIWGKAKRSLKDDESIIKRHLLPEFGNFLIKDIDSRSIEIFALKKKRFLSPKTVSNILTLLNSILNRAHEAGLLYKVPKIRKPKIDFLSVNYNYLKSDTEITAFLNAAKEEGECLYLLYLTAISTGLRAGELAGLKFSDIDFKSRFFTVQHSYNGPTKSGKPRVVPILNIIYKPLQEWALKAPSVYVFSNQRGEMLKESSRAFQEIFKRVLRRANFSDRENGRAYIRFHDLRHTFASHWMMKGGDLFKLQRILGHSDTKMTQRYAHLSPQAFNKELTLFGHEPREYIEENILHFKGEENYVSTTKPN